MTNISQEMTQTQERKPKYPGLFLSPVTFGRPKAAVNVLPCYEMFWYIASSLCHPLVPVHSTWGGGKGLEQGWF